MAIQAGHLDVVVASGVESMSRVPMGSNLTANGFEGFSPKLYERWEVVPQGISAELIAEKWELSREALDEYSYRSHRCASPRSTRGASSGRSSRSRSAPGAPRSRRDRREAEEGHLAREARVAEAGLHGRGQVTAGNSSAIVDGAAAMLITWEASAARLGLERRGRLVSFGLAGVDPSACSTAIRGPASEPLRRQG